MLESSRRKSPRRRKEDDPPDRFAGAPGISPGMGKPAAVPRHSLHSLYLTFLSSRHLHVTAAAHYFLASFSVLLTVSMVFGTTMTTAACVLLFTGARPIIVWFCCFRPKIIAFAPAMRSVFRSMGAWPVYPEGSARKNKIFKQKMNGEIVVVMVFSSVYVAYTGYFDADGIPIYGLYAGRKILKG